MALKSVLSSVLNPIIQDSAIDVPFLERPSPYPKEVPGVVISHCALLITFLGLLTIYNDFICVHAQCLFTW